MPHSSAIRAASPWVSTTTAWPCCWLCCIATAACSWPLLLAIVSSFKDRVLPRELVVFGEVGLAGEIRPVPSGQERLSEAAKHGFTRAIVPKANAPKHAIPGMQVIAVSKLSEALEAL